MPTFQVNDAAGIKEYIKSLDTFEQFDEVIVDLLRRDSIDDKRVHLVRIMIKSLDLVIYRSQHEREFLEPVFGFDKYFEQDIKYLSAAVLFLRKLLETDNSLTDFEIDRKDFWTTVKVSNKDLSYVLDTRIDVKGEAVATVETEFNADNGYLASSHSFRTKSSMKIDELTSVLEELAKAKSYLMKGN